MKRICLLVAFTVMPVWYLSSPILCAENSIAVCKDTLRRNLTAGTISPHAHQNIVRYIEDSHTPTTLAALQLLASTSLKKEQKRKIRAAQRSIADGDGSEWRRYGIILKDDQHDVSAIDHTRRHRFAAHDDIASSGFLHTKKYILGMLQPRRMPPAKSSFYYAINILDAGGSLYYVIAWSSSGASLQSVSDDGTRTRIPVKAEWFGAKTAFEAKIPAHIFTTLPTHYRVEAISWSNRRNSRDSHYNYSMTSRVDWQYKNWARELFQHYAESVALEPNDPLPAVQAIVDAFPYRLATEEVRPEVIADGITMFAEAFHADEWQPIDKIPLKEHTLRELLIWADRSTLFGISDNEYRFVVPWRRNQGRINAEMYEFLFLKPSAVSKMRAILQNNVPLSSDIQDTAAAIEEWLASTQRYRSSLEYFKTVYNSDPVFWQPLYDDMLLEEEQGRTVIASISDVAIRKYWNWSPSFQTTSLEEHGYHYGNCIDIAGLGVTAAKALGLPALHIHYDGINTDRYQAIHSFPAYYNHSAARYIGFRKGYNRIFPYAHPESGEQQILYYIELPIISMWSRSSDKIMGHTYWAATNLCLQTISEEAWEEINQGGLMTSRVSQCLGL